VKIISKHQIFQLHNALISKFGGINGIRDETLLDSALASPLQTFDGTDMFPSIEERAARLGFGLIKNHPFADGNKRIGAHAMLTMLMINDVKISYAQEELYGVILQIADGTGSYDILLNWVYEHKAD